MMSKIINEDLNYMDMEGHITPVLGIDQFRSNIGEDRDIIVLNFIVDGEGVTTDLVSWFEKGYEWILDSDVSPGEVLNKKYYVFVEMKRTSTAPKRIMELLDDLTSLTGIKVKDWTLKINNDKFPAHVETISDNVILSPVDYDMTTQDELNEWLDIAGIEPIKSVNETDETIKSWQRRAGIWIPPSK